MTQSQSTQRDERIIGLHKKGWTAPEIAKVMPQSAARVQNILRDAGRTRFDRGGQEATSERERERERIRQWQEDGVAEREMARRLGRSRSYVKVLRREAQGRTRAPASERDQEIVRLFMEEGADQITIGEQFGITHSRVSQIIRSAGYTREDQQKAAKDWVPDAEIRRLYVDERLTQRQTARHLGLSKTGVRSRLIAMGIELRGRQEAEEDQRARMRERDETIMDRYSSGESIEDLAEAYERTPERIRQIITSFTGVRPRG